MIQTALKYSAVTLSLMGATAALAQDDESTDNSAIDAFRDQIAVCEVNDDGVEQVTLKNGDVIANPDWFHDSFAIAIEDPNGETAILNIKTGEEIRVSDLCARTDTDVAPHPNINMDTDFNNYDYLCVSSGLFVDVIDRKTVKTQPRIGPILSEFHRVKGDETILGSCEFEIDVVPTEPYMYPFKQPYQVPIISYDAAKVIP